MGVKRPVGGDQVCPICLLSTSMCLTCELVQSLKFAKKVSEGVTMTQALWLRHPVVCQKCRRPYKNCWARNGKREYCLVREKAAQDHYPKWWVPSQLPKDAEEFLYEKKEVQS